MLLFSEFNIIIIVKTTIVKSIWLYFDIMVKSEKNMDNSYKEMFKNRLKELREEKGLSQKAVAQNLEIPVSTYANWEQGRREPSIEDIYKILEVLDIEANDLF